MKQSSDLITSERREFMLQQEENSDPISHPSPVQFIIGCMAQSKSKGVLLQIISNEVLLKLFKEHTIAFGLFQLISLIHDTLLQ